MEDSGTIKVSELPKEYQPFHEDVDIEGRLPQEHANRKTATEVKKTVIHTLSKKLFRKDLEITTSMNT